jgi:hypothetical protein
VRSSLSASDRRSTTTSTGLTIVAVAVIAAAVVPWGDFQNHPHWGRVGWLPFVPSEGPVRLRDVIANVILFLPLGAAIAWNATASSVYAAAAGAAISMVAEATQIYSHGRFPSATDVVTNTCGAYVAATLTHRWRSRNSARSPGVVDSARSFTAGDVDRR